MSNIFNDFNYGILDTHFYVYVLYFNFEIENKKR